MTTPSFFGYGLSPAIQVAEIWEAIGDLTLLVNATVMQINLSPAIDFDKVSMVVVETEIISKSGTGNNLVMSVNGDTSNFYDVDGRTIKSGVEIIIDETGAGFKIANPTLLTNVDDIMHGIAYFQLNKAGTNKRIGIQSFANGLQQNANMNISGVFTKDQTELNQVRINNFSATMGAGSKMTIYKVKRKL